MVHALWRPIPGQFDDYIAMPKNNGYQSLHTAVVARRRQAARGPDPDPRDAPHLARSASRRTGATRKGSRTDRAYDAKLAWLRQLMDWQREVSDATEFVEGVKLDIFQDQVFVFTPRGDVKDLPAGATPLDFAYRIHTDVGHACIGAKVNNRLVSLDYKLKNGDIVEIVTTKSAHGPSRDWLNLVTTSHAKEKIRQWFKRQQRDENIVHGKAVARSRAAAAGPDVAGQDPPRPAGRRSPRQDRFASLDDFYAAVGYGAVSAQSVVMKLGVADDTSEAVLPQVAPPPPTRTGGIRVKGVGDLLIRFAKCCHPIPGDPIRGYISRGRGVTVHLATCHTVVNEQDVATGSSTWSGRPPRSRPIPSPSASRRTTGPGCCRTSATSSRSPRSTSSRRTSRCTATTKATVTGHAPGDLGRAAGAG